MSNQLAFLQSMLGDFLEPLRRHLSSPETLEFLFYRYGWDVSLDVASFEQLSTRINADVPLEDFVNRLATLQDDNHPTAEQLAGLASSAAKVLKGLASLEISDLDVLVAPLNEPSFWRSIGNHLLDDLFENFLRVHYAHGYAILNIFGVLRYDDETPDGDHRISYVKTTVDWSALGRAVRNPLDALKTTYRWNDDPSVEFDYSRLVDSLQRTLGSLGVAHRVVAAESRVLSSLAGTEYAIQRDEPAIEVVFLFDITPFQPVVYEIGLQLLPGTQAGETTVSGLVLRPVLQGATQLDIAVADNISFRWNLDVELDDILAAALFPGKAELASGQPSAKMSLEFVNDRTAPVFLIGGADTPRVELIGGTVGMSMEGSASSPEIKLLATTGQTEGSLGCKAVIPLDDADNFIKDSINRSSIEFSFGAEVTWSSTNGLQFNGGAALNVSLPFRINLGAVTLQDAQLAISERETDTENSGVDLSLRTGLSGKLGPVRFSVDGLGLAVGLIPYTQEEFANLPADQEPVFGTFDVQLDFVSPNSLGLSIEMAGLSGGGFLFFDAREHRYAGVIQLDFNSIGLTAIGLLSTRLPDGSDGFSLLAIVSSDDFSPISLGLGFTLNGIGGLLGVNRTTLIEVLRSGLKSGTLDSILFPADPVQNAARIISDLRRVFPPKRGQFLFGPSAIIAWGTPPVFTAEVSLVLEFPSPVRLLVLGQFRVALPSKDEALVLLQMDAVGQVDFDKGTVTVDATLFDSRVMSFALSGDMALRMRWKSDPAFLMSVGGFNPRFRPPDRFPKLKRLTLSLTTGDNPRLQLESYFALTSNTAQIGARLDLFASAGKFSIEGFLYFDTLFDFSPFQFVADIGAGIALKAFGVTVMSVQLEMTLSGPSPWHARGRAKFKILLLKFSVSFDKKIGEDVPPPALPSADPLPLLLDALKAPENWVSAFPVRREMLVSLRKTDNSGGVIVHPTGSVEFQQRVVPLNLEISRFGNSVPSGERRFAISQVSLNDAPVAEDDVEPVSDHFAAAQFIELNDQQKLARPSFELMQSGIQFGTRGFESPTPVEATIDYETITIVPESGESIWSGLHSISAEFLESAAKFGARARVNERSAADSRYRTRQLDIAVSEPKYVVVTTDGLSVHEIPGLDTEFGGTYSEASEKLSRYLDTHSGQRKQLQIVARHETVGASQ